MTGLILIILNVFFSYKGLKDHGFFDRYKFEVEKVLLYKDYKRLLTSGFLHVSWGHLIFNMLSLFFFSGSIENSLGIPIFLIIYFSSLVGGNLLSLFIHKNDSGYSVAGASGAVCGVIFASIALIPGMSIRLFLIPISFPAWVYGLVFVLYSIYGIRSNRDNVGHESHLGGALIGMIVALLIHPSALMENLGPILAILIPTIVFIYLIITRPGSLLVDNHYFRSQKDFYSVDHKYNAERTIKRKEIDDILDKINRRGMNSLTAKEKAKLKEYSKQIN